MAVVVVLAPGWQAKLRPYVSRFMDDLASDIAADARRYAPIDTGRLVESIRVHRRGAYTRRIHAHAPYAAWVEYGTAPHIIRPNSKKALHWPTARHPVAVVHHPGTRAQPYLRPAVYQRRTP
ncbi:hypothetical protein Aph01nite_43790 [Acrocarpospora phusangensis]|uniref:HK97 gp10 family phage protein n=1 Tax=Acrocarpospora phusangensis TaxID=1070424 RepID=A0A919QBE2_9ACTN|nr:HK97 gp10 family phage protein [Acrocarpospora phusangensis]GIH26069.1 hypothetical protein Aph01nite_43790 [Acrocarpospora phusangensis]